MKSKNQECRSPSWKIYTLLLKFKYKIEGLMCIPPNNMNPEPFFDKMLSIRNSLSSSLSLSMGMSSDYREALKRIKFNSCWFKNF